MYPPKNKTENYNEYNQQRAMFPELYRGKTYVTFTNQTAECEKVPDSISIYRGEHEFGMFSNSFKLPNFSTLTYDFSHIRKGGWRLSKYLFEIILMQLSEHFCDNLHLIISNKQNLYFVEIHNIVKRNETSYWLLLDHLC